ncbi:MAG TPA: amidohydrolase family protein [Trebonia sp.]|jgi:imidazolonepropionase-like amidohydrolase|nr:amidohydrolase family protein [Trebonia sp.]
MTKIIRADKLIDGTGGAPIPDPVVVVEGDTITGVHAGRAPEGALPADAEVLDYQGCTLLPGLIDAHVHLNLPGDDTPFEDTVREPDGVLVASAAGAARVALEAGITTVRDTGGRGDTTFQLRRALELGVARGPRMLLVGQPVTITGGHTWYLGGEADGVNGVRLKVRQLAKAGADWIKVMGSGGGTLNTISYKPSFSREELTAIADEAHRLNRKVTVHCLCAEALENAVAAGVDGIEHAGFIINEAGEQVFVPEVAEKIAAAGIVVTTTLVVGYDIVTAFDDSDPVPPGKQAYLDKWKMMLEDNLEQFRKFREAGVNFIAGTDAGWRLTRFDDLPSELYLMTQGGMSALEAIRCGTSYTAEVLGIGDTVGTVKPGYTADIIAVAGDPLGDLRKLRDVRLVLQGGTARVAGGQGVREQYPVLAEAM